jgi:pilus assembly protein Flp/PilA
MKFIKKIFKNENGATAIEYGLIAALISVAAMAAITTLGETIEATFVDINDEMT